MYKTTNKNNNLTLSIPITINEKNISYALYKAKYEWAIFL